MRALMYDKNRKSTVVSVMSIIVFPVLCKDLLPRGGF